MVGQTQMFVSSKGVAFNMQGPPLVPRKNCGGPHYEHFCQMNGQGAQKQAIIP